MFDTWIGRFELGRAYFEAGAFTQADSEFDRCIQRRGEALSLFLDEDPTYGYLPSVYYYQGKSREGLKTVGFAESYRTYVDIRGKSIEDNSSPRRGSAPKKYERRKKEKGSRRSGLTSTSPLIHVRVGSGLYLLGNRHRIRDAGRLPSEKSDDNIGERLFSGALRVARCVTA